MVARGDRAFQRKNGKNVVANGGAEAAQFFQGQFRQILALLLRVFHRAALAVAVAVSVVESVAVSMRAGADGLEKKGQAASATATKLALL